MLIAPSPSIVTKRSSSSSSRRPIVTLHPATFSARWSSATSIWLWLPAPSSKHTAAAGSFFLDAWRESFQAEDQEKWATFSFYFWLPNAELYVEIPMSFVLLSNTRRHLGVDFFSNFPLISFLFCIDQSSRQGPGSGQTLCCISIWNWKRFCIV